MVAPLVAAAGIGAVGSVLGGLFGGGGAKKAAKIQQQTVREQIAAANANRDYITGLSQPAITQGNQASSIYGGLLGLGGEEAAGKALDIWRGSTGYQDLLDTGLGAVNANAYARGMGSSGATLRALQAKGMALADQNQQTYMSNLNNLIQTGNSAIGNLAGVATQTVGANNAAMQNGADAASNAALASGSAWQNALKNLTNIGMNAVGSGSMGSSYGAPPAPTSLPGYGGGMIPVRYGLDPRFA